METPEGNSGYAVLHGGDQAATDRRAEIDGVVRAARLAQRPAGGPRQESKLFGVGSGGSAGQPVSAPAGASVRGLGPSDCLNGTSCSGRTLLSFMRGRTVLCEGAVIGF